MKNKDTKSHPAIVRIISKQKNVTKKRKDKSIKEETIKKLPRYKFI